MRTPDAFIYALPSELVTLLSATSGSWTDRIPKWVVKKNFKNGKFTKLNTGCKEANSVDCGDVQLATEGVGRTQAWVWKEQTPEPRNNGGRGRGM